MWSSDFTIRFPALLVPFCVGFGCCALLLCRGAFCQPPCQPLLAFFCSPLLALVVHSVHVFRQVLTSPFFFLFRKFFSLSAVADSFDVSPRRQLFFFLRRYSFFFLFRFGISFLFAFPLTCFACQNFLSF